ncbi:MAG: nuclear transport factor 2 family protein [Flavobacteriaceae bacterium]|nr:nuclear transport factor 2 family protein [Flavobacteriaceae bacterium]
MRQFYIFFIGIFFSTQAFSQNNNETEAVNHFLDQWHKDVATYDYDAYFDKMTAESIFIGTDATEVWTKDAFQTFAKPFFDKKETWNFTPLDRNIYFSENQKFAWFDELLDTWMGLCRGSGVLTKEGENWRISHYVLSVTIPNDDMNEVIQVKKQKNAIQLNDVRNK